MPGPVCVVHFSWVPDHGTVTVRPAAVAVWTLLPLALFHPLQVMARDVASPVVLPTTKASTGTAVPADTARFCPSTLTVIVWLMLARPLNVLRTFESPFRSYRSTVAFSTPSSNTCALPSSGPVRVTHVTPVPMKE